jgi:hypothetical protein
MNSACLITSGAYVGSELVAEFGRLPPSFLPLGLRRLYVLQVEWLRANDQRVFMSVPADYQIPEADSSDLAALGVTVLPSRPGISLGIAVAACLDRIGELDSLAILHGDTLFGAERPRTSDVMSVGDARDGYTWARARIERERICDVVSSMSNQVTQDHQIVLSGYFSFAKPTLFRRCLQDRDFDFVEAVADYAMARPVLAVTPGEWLDCGHVQTYYRSRCRVAAARSFNSLQIDQDVVTKRSAQSQKLKAEADWFRNAPFAVRHFAGRLLDEREHPGEYAYATEYEYLPTLAELYVFGRLSRPIWGRILESCRDYLARAAQIVDGDAPRDALVALTRDKTMSRLESCARQNGLDLVSERSINGAVTPGLARIGEEMAAVVATAPEQAATLMHGDFCFSNIMYNGRAERIRLIDPRGAVRDGHPTIFGDYRYDVAKLAHSIVGRYDLIMAGRCRWSAQSDLSSALEFSADAEKDWLEQIWGEMSVGGEKFGSNVTFAAMVTLFLSMLPLHADRPDRQRVFVSNALRLYHRYFGGG